MVFAYKFIINVATQVHLNIITI